MKWTKQDYEFLTYLLLIVFMLILLLVSVFVDIRPLLRWFQEWRSSAA